MELTLEQKQIAIAMVEYLREQGYILSPEAAQQLQKYKEAEDEYICGADVARRLGIDRASVTRLKNKGILKYWMNGSKPMYSVKSVNRYIQKRMMGSKVI